MGLPSFMWRGLAAIGLLLSCSDVTVPLDAKRVDVEALTNIWARGVFLARHRVVITNTFVFTDLWETVARAGHLPPDIDFTSQTVIAAGMGSRGSSGFRIEVVAAFLDDSTLSVVVDEVTLGSGCGLFLAAATHPMTVARVDAVARRVEFIEREVIDECR